LPSYIWRIQLQHLTNVTSVPWIGAPAVWNALHAKGEHIKIGIIDTGIDYTHANFGGSGNPADYLDYVVPPYLSSSRRTSTPVGVRN